MTDPVHDMGRSEEKTMAPPLPCGAPAPLGESPEGEPWPCKAQGRERQSILTLEGGPESYS